MTKCWNLFCCTMILAKGIVQQNKFQHSYNGTILEYFSFNFRPITQPLSLYSIFLWVWKSCWYACNENKNLKVLLLYFKIVEIVKSAKSDTYMDILCYDWQLYLYLAGILTIRIPIKVLSSSSSATGISLSLKYTFRISKHIIFQSLLSYFW